jgi:hypothetical protein
LLMLSGHILLAIFIIETSGNKVLSKNLSCLRIFCVNISHSIDCLFQKWH